MNGDGAAGTTISAADSGCILPAGCGDTAAVDGDCVARTLPSAADSGCQRSAGCGDIAAVDGDCAARTALSAADSGCFFSTVCFDTAAVDGDCSARTIISAADSGCIFSAGCGDIAAVDGDGAARTALSAADARAAVITACGQRSHVFLDGLGIDGQFIGAAIAGVLVIILYLNAFLDCEDGTVLQNQADIAGNGDAAADDHSVVDYIPAAIPCGHAAFHHSDIICCLFITVFVQIGNAVRRRQ